MVCVDESFITQADVEVLVVDHRGEDEVVDEGCKSARYVSVMMIFIY